MTSTGGSETHKVRGDGEIVDTLLHHSTSINDNTCSLHFYRDVKFKEPEKKVNMGWTTLKEYGHILITGPL
jgi:hypothetical protein